MTVAPDRAAAAPLPDYGVPYRYVVFAPGAPRDTYLANCAKLSTAWRDGYITATEYAWACCREVDVYCATVGHYDTTGIFDG